jgi:predicted enzyme related to lactoylglutathione lyase
MAAPAVAWFEVTGKDARALQRFYGELFDWKIQVAGDGPDYGLIQGGEKGIGGGIGSGQAGGSGQLTFYVEVGDPAAY